MIEINEKNYKNYINSKEVKLGINVRIDESVQISAVGGQAEYVEIGDNVFIGKDVIILTPEFRIGDYSTIHKQCRISGYKPCMIGHNFWMDQNCILNSTDNLTIGNNVGVGAYSQLWTHIRFGDVLEGCRFNSTKPMIIEDDVWLVGHCIVSPITAKNKSMAMVGSVVTKNMEENHIYAGCPANDITDKIGGQFKPRSIEEKNKMMHEKVEQFFEENPNYDSNTVKIVTKYQNHLDERVSYFNISERTYTKRRTEVEIKLMQSLLPLYKFTPCK